MSASKYRNERMIQRGFQDTYLICANCRKLAISPTASDNYDPLGVALFRSRLGGCDLGGYAAQDGGILFQRLFGKA